MDRYYTFNVTIAAGVTQANPAVAAVQLEDAYLVDVEIIIPPGHVGLTGIQVRQSGTTIVPWGVGRFLVGNDYKRPFDVNTEIGSRAISIAGYNTDVFSHSWDVRFHIRDLHDTTVNNVAAPVGSIAGAITGDLPNPDLPSLGSVPLPAPPGTPSALPGVTPPPAPSTISTSSEMAQSQQQLNNAL